RPERLYLAALAEAHALLGLDPAQVRERGDEPGGAVDLGTGVTRRQILHVTDVVTVTVGDEDQINVAELGEVLVVRRGLGMLREKGIEDDPLAAGRGDLDRRLTEPVHLDLPGLREEHRA